MILVSSCLLGLNTKYDGTNNKHQLLLKYADRGKYLQVCPEQLGGLTTPRPPVEIKRGTGKDVLEGNCEVLTDKGEDKTEFFIRGAEQVFSLLKDFPIKAAILKERSPSCGVHQIYDGTFQHIMKEGEGVTSAILKKANIPVYSEEELTEELLLKLLAE